MMVVGGEGGALGLPLSENTSTTEAKSEYNAGSNPTINQSLKGPCPSRLAALHGERLAFPSHAIVSRLCLGTSGGIASSFINEAEKRSLSALIAASRVDGNVRFDHCFLPRT